MFLVFKRIFDIIISCVLLIVLSPLLLAISIMIKIESPGPAIFKQWRVGRGHKLFKIYKLRTMEINSDIDHSLLHDDYSIFSQIKNDPRVTKTGRLLRKFSLDEIPQLINIILGDMSLIGPRPIVLPEANQLPPIALDRLKVLPGLTGYAQVEGRSDAKEIDRFAHDIYYVYNMSLSLDLKIFFKTIKTVFLGDGAV